MEAWGGGDGSRVRLNGRRVVASVPKGLSKHACAYASSKADNEAVAECRWAFPTLRLSQQRTDSLRALTTGEKLAYYEGLRCWRPAARPLATGFAGGVCQLQSLHSAPKRYVPRPRSTYTLGGAQRAAGGVEGGTRGGGAEIEEQG